MSHGTPTDPAVLEALIGRCAGGDSGALEQLYRVTAPGILGCLMHMLHNRSVAEEVLQDVFVAVWQRAGDFDALRGRVEGWMYSIARYRAIDELRRRRSAGGAYEELDEQTPAPDGARADTGVEFAAMEGALQRCLQALGPTQRRCVTLAFVEGYSHDQIARAVDSPLGTVKSWLRRGLSNLRACLGGGMTGAG